MAKFQASEAETLTMKKVRQKSPEHSLFYMVPVPACRCWFRVAETIPAYCMVTIIVIIMNMLCYIMKGLTLLLHILHHQGSQNSIDLSDEMLACFFKGQLVLPGTVSRIHEPESHFIKAIQIAGCLQDLYWQNSHLPCQASMSGSHLQMKAALSAVMNT